MWDVGNIKSGSDEADDVERVQCKVTVLLEGGSKIEVPPCALTDLRNGDSDRELCLDVVDTPQSVFPQQGSLTDPRENLNPGSTITVRGQSIN